MLRLCKSPILIGFSIQWLLAGSVSKAQTPRISTVQMHAELAKEDCRLLAPVTLQCRNLPLAMVLNRVAEQSGIRIRIDDLDSASGYSVFAVCNKLPVYKVLNSLYGLFSIRGAEWSWSRTNSPTGFEYTFHETSWAKNRAATYNQIVDGILDRYLEAIRHLAPMDVQERRLHQDELRRALLYDESDNISFIFDKVNSWNEANLYMSVLTPEQQSAVLHGHDVSIDLRELPSETNANFRKMAHLGQVQSIDPNGGTIDLPQPTSIVFSRSLANRAHDFLAPMVMVIAGRTGKSWMGTGDLQLGVRKALKRAWLLPGDSTAYTAGGQTVPKVPESAEDASERRKSADKADAFGATARPGMPPEVRDRIALSMRSSLSTAGCLDQFARGSLIPVFAVLPAETGQGVHSPAGHSVEEFVHELESSGMPYCCKWRDRALLVTYPYWLALPTPAIAYRLLKSIQPDLSGSVSLNRLANLMGKVNDDQSGWLAETWGYPQSHMAVLRPMLLLLNRYPALASSTGTYLQQTVNDDIRQETNLKSNIPVSDKFERYRLQIETYNPKIGVEGTLRFEGYTADHRWDTLLIAVLPRKIGAQQAATKRNY